MTTDNKLTLNEAKALARQDQLTFRQLRSVLPSTKGVETPTRDWVRGHLHGEEVFFSKKCGEGDRLVVFKNGFYVFFSQKHWTILRVDGFTRLNYEVDEEGKYKTLKEDEYLDDSFIPALGVNGMWQLKRNTEKRDTDHGDLLTDDDTFERMADVSTPDALNILIKRYDEEEKLTTLEKSMSELTGPQREVIYLRYWKEMTVKDIAAHIGRSEDTVKDRLKGAMKSLKKSFGLF